MSYMNVYVPKAIIDRRDWVKYLIVFLKDLAERFPYKANEKFDAFVIKQIDAYTLGKKVPEEIATPIMNLADDQAAGRPVTMRAGDYIALQTYFKKTVRK